MKLVVEHATVTIHVHPGADTATVDALTRIATAITSLEHTMQEELDRLKQEVSEAKTVMASGVTFIQGLAEQIRNLPATKAALTQMADDLDAQANALAAAIADNTPAEGETGGTTGPVE